MEQQILKISKTLEKYLPVGYARAIAEEIAIYKIKFRITKPRSSKLGDYTAPFGEQKQHKITINGNLNRFAFLITTLHEIAHMHTFIAYHRRASPHGIEWQQAFQKLLSPLLIDDNLPKDVKAALINTVKKTKASSCSDMGLNRVLKRYDPVIDNKYTVEDLKPGTIFKLNEKIFEKGQLRRSRFLCKELASSKNYLVHALAEVEPVLDSHSGINR